MVAAGITISFNWGTFIWAVNNGHIVETSMGYYINPLVSILFAVVFLRERLDKMQLAAITCAFIGVASMVYSFLNAGFYFCFVRIAEKNSAGFCLNKHYA